MREAPENRARNELRAKFERAIKRRELRRKIENTKKKATPAKEK